MFLSGLGVLVVAVNSAIGVYAHPLFWMHMVQHLLLIMVVPVLLIYGQPLRLAARLIGERAVMFSRSRAAGVITSVPVGFALYTVDRPGEVGG